MKVQRPLLLLGIYVIFTLASILVGVAGFPGVTLADGGGGPEPPILDTIPDTSGGSNSVPEEVTMPGTELSFFEMIDIVITVLF